MSQEKKKRTVEEVHQEYSQLCARAGHLQYTAKTANDDLAIVNNQLRELNLEAAAIKASEEVKA